MMVITRRTMATHKAEKTGIIQFGSVSFRLISDVDDDAVVTTGAIVLTVVINLGDLAVVFVILVELSVTTVTSSVRS